MVEQTQHLAQLISKLESLVDRFERAQGGASGTAQPVASPAPKAAATGSSKLTSLLKEYDTNVVSKIKPFEDATNALGGEIITTIVRT